MDNALSNSLSAQVDNASSKALWRAHSQPHFVVSKATVSNVGDVEQKARQEEEKLQLWRIRVQQIRGK